MTPRPRMHARPLLAVLAGLALNVSWAAPNADFDARLQALAPIIGQWPPRITSAAQGADVLDRYRALERELDDQSIRHPEDADLLVQLAWLHAMGHNIEIEDAWDLAEHDYVAALKLAPGNEEAATGLAILYLNSNLALAPKAEQVLLRLQSQSGHPLGDHARSTLVTAYLYQRKWTPAERLARELVAKEPANADYRELLRMATTSGQKAAAR